ncbi:hypothetical protein RCH09_002175 [Actimicrobium sp. GrIS 1.19]|uniref:hypothetical protein n=1 Tax=Actimicrobium sp. GrIS 1.19 TaxID=3071708 RepID=UPI002DFA566B|nr:hypothetical protein [Actimicrobium sp. GrIS 1.19]
MSEAALLGKLVLHPVNERVYRVQTEHGEHVGNLKRNAGLWKFKAIGHDRHGNVMPGWGPLTEMHNTVFDAPDEARVNSILAPMPQE